MKIWFPFNFAKNLKDRYFAVVESKNDFHQTLVSVLPFKKIYF